ncbi:cysteine synthase A [Desulfosporosinus sp. BICA1-9]|uniref:cysteine synthase A n=1 Tax=Desulfosporosinus sp. BICA1-9 TaxID=1531958 RepID=UPI00054B74CD|nr:cysteine synthase A [Desulfosporosinus sp. BICA1-9]KJS48423.1 MAG: cysteine synthase [Peptococcaceae bacterium BRH_c23]KJS77968.1 MAG: cysteine synthase [Desulfosporosinus sp. BICA1-9]HBW35073.1 cysteine synthase A [Desulfosporosinus sp.]
MRVVNAITDLIGQTPLIRLQRMVKPGMASVYIKVEFFNPGGSVKDRIAWGMIQDAEQSGALRPGGTIIEPTSGNTGIGLAMIAAARGYRLIVVMPDSLSVERRMLMAAYGAEFVLTPGAKGMNGAIEEAKRLLGENPDFYMPQQFENPANPEVHRKSTALELLDQFPGLDAFVAGIGTGGTITGVGEILKARLPEVKIIGVEPASSPVISGGKPGPHKIQGIGAGFVPAIFNKTILDQLIQVSNEDALETARRMAREEGVLVGISSGAAVSAALQVAATLGEGKNLVVLAPDTGERYLSTELFSNR